MQISKRKKWTALCFFAAAVGLTGLSTVQAQSPTGKWKGEWTSQSTGHRGPMRANIRPNGSGGYDARFTGRFAVIIPFTYKTSLTPAYDSAGNVHLYANKSLGPILGGYTMHSVVSGNQLSGSFRASKDTGAVRMHRVK